MKVLHLLNTGIFSGAENLVCQIIKMFESDEDYQMVYCSLDGPIRDSLNERKIEFAPIKKMTTTEIARVLNEQKPDIIHAHDMMASYTASRVCKKTPLISHIHNSDYKSRVISKKSIAYLFAALKARRIFWVSNSSLKEYAFNFLLKNKSTILYNILSIEALYSKMQLDKNAYTYDIVYCGRLSSEKDPDRLIDICDILVQNKPDIKIAIIGRGELEEDVISKIKSLGLNKNISVMGFLSNPLKVIHDSKVMIMTSKREGTPMVALESLALGVPLVSTPVDGLKDIIVDDFNGFLSNSNEVISSKILSIINNPSLRDVLSKNAKNFSLKYNDKDNYKKELTKSYTEALN